MKKFKFFLVSLMVIWLTVTLFYTYQIKVERINEKKRISNLWFSQYSVVAHGLGSIDNHAYTNSKEAFLSHYQKGTRVFEVDFVLTSDQKLVLSHGWQEHKEKRLNIKNANNRPLSHQEFKKHLIYDKYTPLDLNDLINLMKQYPDFYLVLDFGKALDFNQETNTDEIFEVDKLIKYNQLLIDEFKKVDEKLLDRVIPQIYYEQHYHKLHKLYPFKNYIYTLYKNFEKTTAKQIMQFIIEHKIDVVVTNNLGKQKNITKEIHRQFLRDRTINASKAIFLHTINDYQEALELRNKGYKGIYSDVLNQGDFNEKIDN